MNRYATIKQAVTSREAAEFYGLSVSRDGMARCPFHNDRRPSLKLDEGFYCFGCKETGDVITFVAKFFDISLGAAATKLAADFNIPLDHAIHHTAVEKSAVQKEFELWVNHAHEVLRTYNDLLFEWKFLRPSAPGEDFHFLFTEALQNSATVRYLMAELAFGTDEEKQDIYHHYRTEVNKLEQRIQSYDSRRYPEGTADQQQRSCDADHFQLCDRAEA